MRPRAFQRCGVRLALMVVTSLLMACPYYGMVDDGTSISQGPSHAGRLVNPARLLPDGDGHVIPSRWAKRGLNYGTDELVSLITYAGRRLVVERPGAVLGVADLSPMRGGPSAWHRSHQTGRDADLLFFVIDAQGQPVRMDSMLHFQADGTALMPSDGQPEALVRFDVERNWLLVRALLQNSIAEVQYIFVYDPLKQLLLDHARTMGEPDDLVAQASFLLHQPGDSAPHDDHFHLRIYCSRSDRTIGCQDHGALHWNKKDYKYGARDQAQSPQPDGMRVATMTPMPLMMVLGAFPFLP